MAAAETDTIRHLTAYSLALRQWQLEQGLEAHPGATCLPGRWLFEQSNDLLEFTDQTFTWYDDAANLDGDRHAGRYGVTRGILTTEGFITEQDPDQAPCYSVTQHCLSERVDGQDQAADWYNLLFVIALSDKELLIYNHRTDTRGLATRLVDEAPVQDSAMTKGS